MKKILKISVLLSVLVMLFGLAACSNPSNPSGNGSGGTGNSGGSKSEVAVYKGIAQHGLKAEGNTAPCEVTITCYSDNTFVIHEYGTIMLLWINCLYDIDVYAGTYTGDPSKDGTINIRVTKTVDEDAINDYLDNLPGIPSSIEITSEHGPLKDIPSQYQVGQTIQIVNGEFELRIPDNPIDRTILKRQ